ncbi:MAG: MbcA/ParS/Xre antitoxin family protein [Polyangiaceae bacterium]|nr:MbcA/ParS/Xre antitoxin family protein [Polyangiaceae bacterium]
MKPEFVGVWLQTPNDAFGGLKPIEVVERGDIDRLWRMIHELESGSPG